MNVSVSFQHFILTRFNLLLWNKDKEGNPVRSVAWLEHRFSLFERYTLPSIANQTNKNFVWIVLFDSNTPEVFKQRISSYQEDCPLFVPIFVKPKGGRFFAQIFRDEVVKRLDGSRVITTYLDNDDALNKRFVEDLQRRALDVSDGTFITYNYGYQLYTDHNYVMQIHYPRNHFVSVVEDGNSSSVKTIYGYGSHYYIDKIKGVRIEFVKDMPMWCEVIHEKNMGNDAYFLLGAKMVNDTNLLKREFAIDEVVNHSFALYTTRFIPRYIKTFIRRIGYFLFGRHW